MNTKPIHPFIWKIKKKKRNPMMILAYRHGVRRHLEGSTLTLTFTLTCHKVNLLFPARGLILTFSARPLVAEPESTFLSSMLSLCRGRIHIRPRWRDQIHHHQQALSWRRRQTHSMNIIFHIRFAVLKNHNEFSSISSQNAYGTHSQIHQVPYTET